MPYSTTSAAGVPAPEPALYSTAGLGRLAQDAAFVRELKLLFLAEVPARLRELRALLEAADRTQLARQAHSLKSMVGTLGLTPAVQLLADLERSAARAVEAQQPPHLAPMLRQLELLLSPVVQQLARELPGGRPGGGAA